ncbi:Hsp20/alpha crystallin family protein [Paenarthrobacter sp. NPDC092416]|uniref:Hsp20/alpha crystallin family protein n=1 Tax=Paenarthrobacter sp. NPDC092416 TaxID=3364386 RepID=UPI003824388F
MVRAELPGIDPEKDAEITVFDGTLTIKAERQAKKEQKEKEGYRSEFRYGSFVRRVPLPDGVKEGDVTASYKDGVLEVRAPIPEPAAPAAAAARIPITKE